MFWRIRKGRLFLLTRLIRNSFLCVFVDDFKASIRFSVRERYVLRYNILILSFHLYVVIFHMNMCCWVILQELPNSCPQTLMSHYWFRFWNILKILCGLCRSICMCIFTILKFVISLKARKRFWFYSGKGSLFHVSRAQFCSFLIQSCNEVTSL